MLLNIQIITNEWIDIVTLDNLNNNAKRLSTDDDGSYNIEDNILKINWVNWGLETFIKNDNIYYNIKNNIFEIKLENNEWNDIGIFNNDDKTVKRKYYEKEIGNYDFKDNILYITWKNWGLETFHQLKYGKYYVNTNFGNLIKDCRKNILKL